MKMVITLTGPKGKYCGKCRHKQKLYTFNTVTNADCCLFLIKENRRKEPTELKLENKNSLRCEACLNAERNINTIEDSVQKYYDLIRYLTYGNVEEALDRYSETKK